MSAPPYMRFYVAEYLADNRSFTTEEHGAYLLLIMEYWRNGGLPTDDRSLAKIAGLCDERWLSVRSAIAQRFSETWCHKRVDQELKLAEDKSAKAYKAALKSLESRQKKRTLSRRKANAERTLSERGHIKDKRYSSTSSNIDNDLGLPASVSRLGELVGIRGNGK